ncbi:MAG TPA: isopentenyl phosphate kinase family protein [Chloroflexi bacterium]|nr:isopentenyl phosphate kinase family protein [Chloroflexota bacterium]
MQNIIFLKLGGSLITDKTQAYTVETRRLARLAEEVGQALDKNAGLKLLLGHGSGSFGHWAAKPYDTRHGVETAAQWRGYAEVAAAAAHLNHIVTQAFCSAGVPVWSLQPSASARCHDYVLQHLDVHPIHAALARDLVPLVYGDVALDDVHGGTIISTEDIFLFLAHHLRPTRILLLGQVDGVLDSEGRVIPRITPADLPAIQQALSGSAGVDVTGGMTDKVSRMIELVQGLPATCVHILNGARPGALRRTLLDPAIDTGTRIYAPPKDEDH